MHTVLHINLFRLPQPVYLYPSIPSLIKIDQEFFALVHEHNESEG